MTRAIGIVAPVVLFFGLTISPGTFAQQNYPNRPIRIIVGNSPGTAPDRLSRAVGDGMSQLLGQPVIIENKEGASGLISFEYVAKQVPADGYTILLVTTTSLATLPATVKDLHFDVLKDLAPVIGLAEQQSCVASSRKNPWKTWDEAVATIKANPGKYNYGTSSVAGWLNLLTIMSGLEIVRIPYKGGGPMLQALLSQDIAFATYGVPELVAYGQEVRALVCTGDRRDPLFPDAPTYKELGVPSARGPSYAFEAPAGTPKAIVDKLHDVAAQVIRRPELREAMAKAQITIAQQDPEQLRARIASEVQHYTTLAQKAGIEPQ